MREWCGCGAGIHARPKQVALWRVNHKHDSEEPGPQKNGSEANTERAAQVDYDQGPFFSARIGFRPNREQT
jgi:hypothetical protein